MNSEPEAAHAPGQPLCWTSGPLAHGLACYRAEEFFEAHEHWESVWLTLGEPEKSFLQAVIQITAAMHHLQRGNLRGARSLLVRSLRRLHRAPARFAGIHAQTLCAEIQQSIQQLDSAAAVTRLSFPQILTYS